MTRGAGLAVTGALVLAAAAAGAAEPGDPDRLRGPLERAWRDATAMATRSLSEEGASRITMLAYVSAVGRTCEGLDVNGARFKGAFRELAEERKDELTDDRKTRSALRRVSYHLGVATGIFLSEHALDGERFCTGARTSIAADPEIAAFFTTNAAPASGNAP
jgi:hypothetical protein